MLEVVEINRLEDLEPLRPVWQTLFHATAGSSFFHTFDWTTAYLGRYGQNQQPRILVVYENGRPIGIVPLTVIQEQTRIGSLRVLTYPLADWGTFFGPLGAQPEKTLSAALRHIRRTARNWDLLDLRWVPPRSVSREALIADGAAGETFTFAALASNDLAARKSVWKKTAILDFDGDWEQHLASRGGHFRNNLKRAERRTQSLGTVEYVRYRPFAAEAGDGDPRWDLYDACVDLAEKSWQGSSADGTTLSHASVRNFLRETHACAARLGMVDVNLLLIDGRPAAFGYNYHHRGVIYGLRAGYDTQYHQAGIGVVLYARMFRDSFERKDKLFDLGPGSLESKRRWITRTAQSWRFTHYPLMAPRAQLLRVKHWLFNDRELDGHGKGAESAVEN